jgi:sulfonate transport system substrate-binding protein
MLLVQGWVARAMLSVAIVAATIGGSQGEDWVERIGYRKTGRLVLLKRNGRLEDRRRVPSDGCAAFERGMVDAWVIFDPFQSGAQIATGPRTLADGIDVASYHQIYFSLKGRLQSDLKIVDLRQLSELDDRAGSDICALVERPTPPARPSPPVAEVALKRQSYEIKRIEDGAIAGPQVVRDSFYASGRIPKPIRISDVARSLGI